MRSGSFLGGVALALFTTLSAQAADLGVRPAVPASPGYIPATYYWTGFYTGGEIGGGWARASWSDPLANATTATVSPSGFVFGGIMGVNYQMGPVVAGIEGNFDGTWFNGSTIDAAGNTLNTKMFWTASIAGRVGYAFDRLLIYARGGAAFAYDRSTETQAGTLLQDLATTARFGWTVGGGLDYAFNEHWFGRIEYVDYLSFPSTTVAVTGGFPNAAGAVGLKINEVKTAVALHKF